MSPDFAPLPALAGGVIIGLAASLALLGQGRIAGISGIFGGMLTPKPGDFGWRAAFVVGLLLAGAAGAVLYPQAIGRSDRPLWVLALAGLLVGFGTRLGNGCTSGHGVCGLARLSVRSLAAVLTFISVAMATATLWSVVGGA